MNDENLPAPPTRQAIAARGRSAPNKVSGKLKVALERMVWHGDKRADAATFAGLKDHSLRCALRRPHVLAHYHAELQALREAERPRSHHALAGIRDGSENDMARVRAAQILEQQAGESSQHRSGRPFSPGIVIQIVDRSAGRPAPVIEHEPTIAISNDAERDDD